MKELTNEQRKKIYLKLAKQIAKSLRSEWFVCCHINTSYYPELQLMEPTEKTYEGAGWFSESRMFAPLYTKNNIEGNKHRVMALLLCAAMCD